MKFKVFDLYETEGIDVEDPALKPYVNLEPRLMIKFQGRKTKSVNENVHIVERLANRIAVPGHFGKKHKIITSWSSGQYRNNMKIVIEAFKIIEKRKRENPLRVFVKAIENCSPRDEITTIEYGGARYPQAVDVSPNRRINLAVRWIVQGAYQKAFGKKKKMAETLANEIILASEKNMESFSMQRKNESEKQADAAR